MTTTSKAKGWTNGYGYCWVALIADPSNCLPFNNRDSGSLELATFNVPRHGIAIAGYFGSRNDVPPGEAAFVQIGDISGIPIVQFMTAVAR